ncbi:MAG: hypothetical protein JSV64_03450 [Candidatus Bathyarchaeota archaeon]|nr:MAG: hypothetical protein JSV64_03450 [Candidatus Bathyarchaeota archaeon]
MSLVILTIIVANVILWSYELNQMDWERMQEGCDIVEAVPISHSLWSTTQAEYTPNFGAVDNGTFLDTQTMDNISQTFIEGPGPQQRILHPNEAGQYAEWASAFPGATPHWDCCNEEFPDDDDSYVENIAATWKKEVYNLENETSSGTINWVRIYVRARLTQPGTSLIRTLIRSHDQDYESADLSLTTSYQNVYTQYDRNPYTDTTWTWDEINSAQVGASSRKAGGDQYVRMTAVWMELEYTIPGGQRLDFNGTFNIDLSIYPLAETQTMEIQMRYRASDVAENWYLEAYNWVAAEFSDFGFNNTSGSTPTMDWDMYTVNLTDKWLSYINDNGTICLKVTDNQADINMTILDVDLLAVRAKIDGTRITVANTGSLTCHLVALWINNSTVHQRFDINIFINAGETIDYINCSINLPKKPFIAKVITERGNIALYSET